MDAKQSLIFYPRGYTVGPADAQDRGVSTGDLVVDSLYEYLMSSKGRTKNWKFHAMVLDAALIHFGDFHAWFDTQLGNPLIVGPYREFLIQTAQFIDGRPRPVHHASWIFMLGSQEPVNIQTPVRRYYESSQYLPNLTTIRILQKWCEKKDGVYDLLQTMYVLFGRVGRTPA